MVSVQHNETRTVRQTWQTLRPKYAETFTCTASEVYEWHRQQAQLGEATQHWPAAVFHLDRLIAARPRDETLRERRAQAQAKLKPAGE